MGSSTENSAYGPSHNPWDPLACPAARAAAPPPPSRAGSRPGRSAPTPAARSSSRPRSAASSAYGLPTAPSPATASSPSPRRSTRSGPVAKTSATARSSRVIAGRERATRRGRRAGAVELPSGGPAGLRIGVPSEMNVAEGIEAASRAPCTRDRAGRGLGPGRRVLAAAVLLRAGVLLRDRARRGSSNLARYDGVRSGCASTATTSARCMAHARRRVRREVKRRIMSAPTRSRPATTTRITSRRRKCGRWSGATSTRFARFDI